MDRPESDPLLTFVIPLRHPQNSPDWGALKQRLGETIRSIAAQDDPRWRAIIVANAGADLPELPRRFQWKPVDFPPNPMFERGDNELEAFRDACRLDKGRRVLAGILAAGTTGYVMVVDDDDLVSRRLTGFVAENRGKSGWYVERGYLWGDGGKLLYQYADFSTFCGTSHIVRADLYDVSPGRPLPDSALVRTLFGSHIFIREYLAARGRSLEPLPFLGAVYRIGHAGAHSKSPGLLRQVFFKRELLRHPLQSVQRLSGLRLLGPGIRRQFWGIRP
jgi:hypothetical protein